MHGKFNLPIRDESSQNDNNNMMMNKNNSISNNNNATNINNNQSAELSYLKNIDQKLIEIIQNEVISFLF